MFRGFALIALLIGGVSLVAGWLLWTLVLRPLALAYGFVEMTADDYVVQGWKAEREGRWTDALHAYDDAIQRVKRHEEANRRRAELLERQPELEEEAEQNRKRIEEEKARKQNARKRAKVEGWKRRPGPEGYTDQDGNRRDAYGELE